MFQMGNDSPHFSPNLHLNWQIKMPELKSRSELGLLNAPQGGARSRGHRADVLQELRGRLRRSRAAQDDHSGREAQLRHTGESHAAAGQAQGGAHAAQGVLQDGVEAPGDAVQGVAEHGARKPEDPAHQGRVAR